MRKLPKPSNATQSLQPLFEAVSNPMFGIEDRYRDDVAKGRIDITVTKLADPRRIEILIADDGMGLDADRYAAFCEVDTDFKKSKGCKGVGRLFWLDAFDRIEVDSTYGLSGGVAERRGIPYQAVRLKAAALGLTPPSEAGYARQPTERLLLSGALDSAAGTVATRPGD